MQLWQMLKVLTVQRNMETIFGKVPLDAIYVGIAVIGGIARYLNGFVNGNDFKLSVFFASAFVAGFSGYMFALLGDSLSLPPTMLHIMAGTGGFMGDQTLKFIMEYVGAKLGNAKIT